MRSASSLVGGVLFLAGSLLAAHANAAELKVLSVGAVKPALQQLAPAFEAASKNRLEITYAKSAVIVKKINDGDDYDIVILDQQIAKKLAKAAKLAGGLIKTVANEGGKTYAAASTNWSEHALADRALVDFLASKKSQEVFKSKGLKG